MKQRRHSNQHTDERWQVLFINIFSSNSITIITLKIKRITEIKLIKKFMEKDYQK